MPSVNGSIFFRRAHANDVSEHLTIPTQLYSPIGSSCERPTQPGAFFFMQVMALSSTDSDHARYVTAMLNY